jgi:hypothetical protein
MQLAEDVRAYHFSKAPVSSGSVGRRPLSLT